MAIARTVDEIAIQYSELLSYVKMKNEQKTEVYWHNLVHDLALTPRERKKIKKEQYMGFNEILTKKIFKDANQLNTALRDCRKYGLLTTDGKNGPWRLCSKAWLYSLRGMITRKILDNPIDKVDFNDNISIFGFPIKQLSPENRIEYQTLLSNLSEIGEKLMYFRVNILKDNLVGDDLKKKKNAKIFRKLAIRKSRNHIENIVKKYGYEPADVSVIWNKMVDELPKDRQKKIAELENVKLEDIDSENYSRLSRKIDALWAEAHIPLIAVLAPEIQHIAKALFASIWDEKTPNKL